MNEARRYIVGLVGLLLIGVSGCAPAAASTAEAAPSPAPTRRPTPTSPAVSVSPTDALTLAAGPLSAGVRMDGLMEAAWSEARPLRVPMRHEPGEGEPAFYVELRALYDERALYLWARWPDAAPYRSEGDVNRLTLHWRIPDGGVHCEVACHSLYTAPTLQLRAIHVETIPPGPAGGLLAAGGWRAGEWAVEWERPLAGGNPYDAALTPLDRPYPFFIKVYEFQENRADPRSPMLSLVFEQP